MAEQRPHEVEQLPRPRAALDVVEDDRLPRQPGSGIQHAAGFRRAQVVQQMIGDDDVERGARLKQSVGSLHLEAQVRRPWPARCEAVSARVRVDGRDLQPQPVAPRPGMQRARDVAAAESNIQERGPALPLQPGRRCRT